MLHGGRTGETIDDEVGCAISSYLDKWMRDSIFKKKYIFRDVTISPIQSGIEISSIIIIYTCIQLNFFSSIYKI